MMNNPNQNERPDKRRNLKENKCKRKTQKQKMRYTLDSIDGYGEDCQGYAYEKIRGGL